VEDDLPVAAGKVDELLHQQLADAGALEAVVDHDVADVRAVDAVGNCAPGRDDSPAVMGDAPEHAVRVGRLQPVGALVAERRDAIELGQLVPVYRVDRVRPFDGHEASVGSVRSVFLPSKASKMRRCAWYDHGSLRS